MRLHVTSGTTGEPVAIGLTAADHAANSAIGGEAFRIAGVRPHDTIAHCLNYALYAGGIADHMALEASGATVVPVGVGQSARLLELIPGWDHRAVRHALLSRRPRGAGARSGDRPARARPAPHRHRGRARRRPGRRARGDRGRVGSDCARHVRHERCLVDHGRECGEGDGLHLTTLGWAVLEVVDPESGEPVIATDPRTGVPAATRRVSSCGPTCVARPPLCCAIARRTSARLDGPV